jgi:hypothetical protein
MTGSTKLKPLELKLPERACDWVEDYEEEAIYISECSSCGIDFYGHERRETCKLCSRLSELHKDRLELMHNIRHDVELGSSKEVMFRRELTLISSQIVTLDWELAELLKQEVDDAGHKVITGTMGEGVNDQG